MIKAPQKAINWADINELDDDNAEIEGLVAYDQDGNKHITTYYREADGRQMKCERKVTVHRKTMRVPVGIKERRKVWVKFGLEALDFEKGDNKKFSTFPAEKDETLSAPRRLGLLASDNTDDQLLSGSASYLEVNRKAVLDVQRLFGCLSNPDYRQMAIQAEKEELTSSVPAPDKSFAKNMETEDRTIRVTNLPEYTDEDNLKKLFGRCGVHQRFFLARNKDTNASKGFAFITYRTRQEADNAIKKLHKIGFQNVLLNVEWARKKNPMDPSVN